MVGFHRACLPAQLAPPGHEPGDQLFAADGDRRRDAVGNDRVLLAPQWNATEPCYQWFAAFTLDAGLEAPA